MQTFFDQTGSFINVSFYPPKLCCIFGVDRVNLSKVLFIYCFYRYANLQKICNSGFCGDRGFFVEDYQEGVYEKFQVNSTYGLAGRAIRSSHPML